MHKHTDGCTNALTDIQRHTDWHMNILTDVWTYRVTDRHTLPPYSCQISQNFPIASTVLALDSWNYYSGQQGPTAQYIHKIAQSSLYSWTMLIKPKYKVLPHYVNSQPQGGIFQGILQPFIHWSHIGKHWEEDVGLSGLAIQSDSCNCLVSILHKQLGKYLLGMGRATAQQPNISRRLHINQCLILTNNLLPTHEGQEQHAASNLGANQ